MISYSQNQEDVVLFRLTRLIDSGIYVDVGAGHPILDNVTYALYLAGWRGIHVEPMEREAQLLRDVRVGDEVLKVALGATEGTLTLYEAPLENRGASTFDVEVVKRYEEQGQKFVPTEVRVSTLDSVLSRFSPGSVHILKIDVEGFEREVLIGGSLHVHQPWVLVIEATQPNTQIDSSMKWENLVLESGYSFCLFDGLNRFYVRNDLAEIHGLLSVPANYFDHWRREEENNAVAQVGSLLEVLAARDVELVAAVAQVGSLLEVLAARDVQLHESEVYVQALLEVIDRLKT
jgi:FkbM family methyltransferase